MSEILLVGDRPEELRALAGVLAPLGYELVSATSAAEALRLLEQSEFALVILEAGMRWRDGLETARLIKAQRPGREVPVLFLAADECAEAGGYWVGTVDYVLAAFDAELLRSRVGDLAELEASRLALKRSEALLRGAFEAAPIGKTVLDEARRIVRANRAFALLLGRDRAELLGTDIASLARPDDRSRLITALSHAAQGALEPDHPDRSGFDTHLRSSSGAYAWTCAYVSAIDAAELDQPLLMIQWVDLSPRRRAEQAQAKLQREQSARTHAEATAERLNKLQLLTDALETLTLDELLPELALRVAEHFEAQIAEVEIEGLEDEDLVVVRAAAGRVLRAQDSTGAVPAEAWHELALVSEGTPVGRVRLVPSAQAPLAAADRSLLTDFAERAAPSIRRAQLHEQEHRIAATLQEGLRPTGLPRVRGLELRAHYDPVGDVAEVGGDWYDAFALRGARLGIVLGDVAGKGIPAASTMGQIRTVTRAFALGDEATRAPGDVLTRLNRYQLALGAEEMFTVLYAIIDPHRGNISWANAGHPPPLLHSSAGESYFLEGGNGLMGIDDVVYVDLHHEIAPLDTLIFYTDGLVERRGEVLDAGLERLVHAVAAGPDDPETLIRHIVAQVVPAERSPYDDVTIVVARVR
ncbi:MAG TPA: SpoIIE family protein phosphatase [Solirubrobacteraceae bacterium]|jgi:PAS domain S-box-containing protein|nr:SpoIIE family protein phosphatase [Solirubrobacteraceae bacterium]